MSSARAARVIPRVRSPGYGLSMPKRSRRARSSNSSGETFASRSRSRRFFRRATWDRGAGGGRRRRDPAGGLPYCRALCDSHPGGCMLAREPCGQNADVRVFDVQQIKGLEFEAVFFVSLDQLAAREPALFDKFLYVERHAQRCFWTGHRRPDASGKDRIAAAMFRNELVSNVSGNTSAITYLESGLLSAVPL
jgi:hypothetical protein